MQHSPELLIKNIEYLIQYGSEPEIQIILNNGKKIFIIAYEDFIDFYDENNNYQKFNNMREATQKIDFANIRSVENFCGLDFSRPIQEQSLPVDGVLYLTSQEKNEEKLDDWRMDGNEDYLNNLTLYEIKFPEFWKKSRHLKNTFYKIVINKAEELVKQGSVDKMYLDKRRIHHIWHSHCEFCWETSAVYKCSTSYCTKDFKHWICQKCFNDFKDKFSWTVNSEEKLL